MCVPTWVACVWIVSFGWTLLDFALFVIAWLKRREYR